MGFWRNMVLVEMNVLLHLKLDCFEILSVGFSGPKNSIYGGGEGVVEEVLTS